MKNTPLKHASLFTGIGGFDLAASWMGWENVFQCEIEPFCQKILKYFYPQSELFTDIKTSNFEKYHGTIDIITGGFPCQPFSVAGKRRGTDDDRYLWAEMLRAIREVQPRWIVAENVCGLLTMQSGMVFERVCADLENAGYEVQPFVVPACAVGAPHRRDRVWIVACSGVDGNAHSHISGQVGKILKGESLNTCGNSEIAAHAKPQQRKTVQRIQQKEPIGEMFGDNGKCRIVAHSDSDDAERQGLEQAERTNGADKSRRNVPDNRAVVNFGDERATAHASTKGLEGKIYCGKQERKGNEDKFRGNITGFGREISTHAESKSAGKLQNKSCAKGTCRRNELFGKQHTIPNWNNFPTQSPVCSRNDGLSGEMADISFSKWRNESIKALGNAIVPQIAYQIFKAIQIAES
jgi:DNA (cytosine-5)-methyltransferase 1